MAVLSNFTGRLCEGSKKLGAALVELEIFAEATVDAVKNISELEDTCEMTGRRFVDFDACNVLFLFKGPVVHINYFF